MDPWRLPSVFSQFGQLSNSDTEEEEEKTNYLEWEALCYTTATTLVYYSEMYIHKQPCHTSIRSGSQLIHEILTGNETRCYQDFRMYKSTFYNLCADLVHRYGLVCTSGMSVYEEVGMFLMTCAHGVGNRLIQEMFNHSSETISRHFHSVLQAVNRLAADIIKSVWNYATGVGYHTPQNPRYLPYFKVSI